MSSIRLEDNKAIYPSNIRAEDGYQRRGAWNSLREGVLIPLGSLFAVFVVMLGLMLISY